MVSSVDVCAVFCVFSVLITSGVILSDAVSALIPSDANTCVVGTVVIRAAAVIMTGANFLFMFLSPFHL